MAATDRATERQPIVRIDLDALRKKKLFVATPCYGGMTHSGYTRSLL